MSQNVKFYFGLQKKYDALTEKNPLALYFIEDTQRLYKGDVLIAAGAMATSMAAGLMSAEDKANLDALVASGGGMSAEDKAFIDSIPSTYATIERVKDTAVQVKYEIASAPTGTLVNYGEDEIRIMCPDGVEWVKQSVGVGGDPNCYYVTFKTYVPDDNIVGYIEHLGNQVDSEILTDFSTDEYGRRYQPTWLAIAKYDEATDTWAYYGDNSTESKYIGWDYQIDWYDANGVMVATDSIRINLSNADCHNSSKPYYLNNYATIEQVAKIEETLVWSEITEF